MIEQDVVLLLATPCLIVPWLWWPAWFTLNQFGFYPLHKGQQQPIICRVNLSQWVPYIQLSKVPPPPVYCPSVLIHLNYLDDSSCFNMMLFHLSSSYHSFYMYMLIVHSQWRCTLNAFCIFPFHIIFFWVSNTQGYYQGVLLTHVLN